ncbi:RelA/SpoT family protein [Georgenia sp. Z1491]|uniref:RelA/SpoT family protein n=1 Tax=Georgenia sp. Z1491 TaxID=3416707 RepID=UPI003CE84B32
MTIERTGQPAASSPSGWGRSRLVWLGGRSHQFPAAIEPVIGALRASHPKANVQLVRRAYEVAERAHEGQTRKSGEPYITHPVAVTTILAELGMPDVVVASALLHDTVEDTDYSLDQVRKDFGDEIALLVDGVTKLDKVHYGEAAQAETVRKMVVAMAKDIRVLVIKLADRLHNARTWRHVSQESARRKARETLEIYAPLAHRLGVNTIKWELEDLSFRTLYPKVYDEIDHLVAERAPARDEYLAKVRSQIEQDLKTHRLKAVVTGRPKHHYSIYQKMIVRGRDFDDIFDLVGVRVLVDSVGDCYTMLGAVHARWTPMPGRFKDYIAMPKFNLYQSLHTTVLGPGGRPVEIQIRTHAMHRRAEYGVAAHWKYKEGSRAGRAAPEPSGGEMGWLRQLVDWQKETADPGEFLDSLRYEMAGSQVYVFTPKGDVLALPGSSTAVDFAYAVHTEVGHRTVGAKVNGKLVPLDRRLDNGDSVEVITSKSPEAGPSQDWLSFVASPRAKNKIRQWFTKERREEAVEGGRNALAKAMRKQNMPIQRLMSAEAVHSLAVEMRYADVTALYAAIGEGHVSAANVVAKLVESMGGDDGAEETLAEATIPGTGTPVRRSGDSGIAVEGMDGSDVWVKIARCCTPVPGDPIVGFITRSQGVSVHHAECQNVDQLRTQSERLVGVEWVESPESTFLVQVQVEALDRHGLLSDLTRVLSENHVNILSASISTTRERVAIGRFVFEMAETAHLGSVLRAIRQVQGVLDVQRVMGRRPEGRRG